MSRKYLVVFNDHEWIEYGISDSYPLWQFAADNPRVRAIHKVNTSDPRNPQLEHCFSVTDACDEGDTGKVAETVPIEAAQLALGVLQNQKNESEARRDAEKVLENYFARFI